MLGTLPHPYQTAEKHFRSVLAALKAAKAMDAADGPPAPPAAIPFVTISRQAGAGGQTLALRLTDALNQLQSTDPPWNVWDHELIAQVSARYDIPEDVMAALEDSARPWFGEFLGNLLVSESHRYAEEYAVYRRVARTVRALAGAGRAIIVGRGGVFVTRGMPGGVHLRLVAPLEHRINNIACRLDLTLHAAARRVTQLDQYRDAFYRRFWPNQKLLPEEFTLTINTADFSDRRMADCVLPIVIDASRPASAPRPPRRCRCHHDAAVPQRHAGEVFVVAHPARFGNAI